MTSSSDDVNGRVALHLSVHLQNNESVAHKLHFREKMMFPRNTNTFKGQIQ